MINKDYFLRIKYFLKRCFYKNVSPPPAILYEKYRSYTMLRKDLYIQNLNLCLWYLPMQGAIVECGVWRGGMLAGMIECIGTQNRQFYAFDSFEGLPKASAIDGEKALIWQSHTHSPVYYDNCKSNYEQVVNLLTPLGISRSNIVKGWFADTLPHFKEPIAILRLDADWYQSTYECLHFLFPYVVKGGLIIIDDYYAWEGCSRAVHDFLSKEATNCTIRQWHNQIAYILKT
ncbi:MAG: TylF/MycF family methyltransferase [Microscillaceae bacterium]|nr:TylF/MycF family methyltransferase [Microscillaceae bacterium]MDW8461405.1 TylF/MycF/NovP-related O-methyltransferase [Cytophagales bacterium]